MRFKAVIFDLDGVIYLGRKAVPGVPAAVSALRKNGVKIFFLTNNATRSRATLVRRLKSHGIISRKSEIDTSAFASAQFIARKKPHAKVFVFGERGLKDELKAAGLRIVAQKPDFVVSGLDRHATYNKLSAALAHLISGTQWIACNYDATLPFGDGKFMPGSGAFCSALSYASGRKPDFIVGKPNPAILLPILAECKKAGIKNSEIALVGDRLDIDVLLANRAGIFPILVLTGVASAKDAKRAKGKLKPKLVLKSAADLAKIMSA